MDSEREKAAREAGFNTEDLEWISSLRRDIDEHQETGREKFVRKLKSNPLVPIGCLATAVALSFGLWNFQAGRGRSSQRMMQLRVLAQGFTVAALIGGMAVNVLKSPEGGSK